MVKLNRIYTRTGDDGSTGLGTGERCLKNNLRIHAMGDVDEANATIGVARLYMTGFPELDALLRDVQNDLFDLGADLCIPKNAERVPYEPLRIAAKHVSQLERAIDRLNFDLKPLTSFILPAGSPASAHLHLARTVARRAERQMIALTIDEAINPYALKFINRLSDFLFVAARWVDREKRDELWIPRKNTDKTET
jgi:cob(I)alamin adenosyltransferase